MRLDQILQNIIEESGKLRYACKSYKPSPKNRLKASTVIKANAAGLKHHGTSVFWSYYTPVLQAAYNLGLKGIDLSSAPIVKGIRYGEAPNSGLSTNYKSGKSELGLSLAQELGHPEIGSSIWFSDRNAYEYSGIKIGTGSDGETLILPLHVEDLDGESVNEMAAPYRSSMPKNSRVFASVIPPVGLIKGSSAFKVIIGDLNGSGKDSVAYIQDGEIGKPMPLAEFSKDLLFIQFAKKNNKIDIQPLKKSNPSVKEVVSWIVKAGFKEVTQIKRPGADLEYATGTTKEQSVKPFKGTVFHGTTDIEFTKIANDYFKLGGGHHLTSLQSKDAFSVSTDFDVSKEFAIEDKHEIGMVIEYAADFQKVYYPSQDEDDFDEVMYPPGTDAVAIPLGYYNEFEIAVLEVNSKNLKRVAVHLPVGREWKRYENTKYIAQWLEDVFGKGFSSVVGGLSDLEVNGRTIRTGSWTICLPGKIGPHLPEPYFYQNEKNPFGSVREFRQSKS